MKKISLIIVSLIIAASFSLGGIYNHSAAALSFKNFDPSNIIDDATFYDSKSMSAGQVQSFLDKKVPNCDTQGSGSYEGTTVKKYWTPLGEPAPYTCLKDWKQNTPKTNGVSGLCSNIPKHTNRSGAEIITDISKACGVSPKVLLVLLEKEKSLISDRSPLSHNSKWSQYKYATGFGCPDTAPCDPDGAGFFNQVYSAAYQFKLYRANPTNYNYIAHQSNYVQYNPNKKCGGSRITIKNQATAGLYNYTPYQPNKATLAVPAGATAKCGAYGNKNFWFLFTTWFGSTTNNKFSNATMDIDYRHDQLGGSSSLLGAPKGSMSGGGSTYWQSYDNGYIMWGDKTGAWESYGPIRDRWSDLGYQNGKMGRPISKVTTMGDGGQYQRYENGYIIGKNKTGYWESKGSIRNYWSKLGYNNGKMGYPTGPEVKEKDGSYSQSYENGYIIGSGKTGYWESKGSIRNYWVSIGGIDSRVKLPTGPEVKLATGIYKQEYEDGIIIGSSETGYWTVTGSIKNRYTSLGEGKSDLGLPVANEEKDGSGGWQQKYQNGYIAGKSGKYYESKGSIRDYWIQLGGPGGQMGAVISGIGGGKTGAKWQRYENGYIFMNPNDNKSWESKGAIRRYWKELGYQNGIMGFPAGPEVRNGPGDWSQKYENGIIHYTAKRTWHTIN